MDSGSHQGILEPSQMSKEGRLTIKSMIQKIQQIRLYQIKMVVFCFVFCVKEEKQTIDGEKTFEFHTSDKTSEVSSTHKQLRSTWKNKQTGHV